MNIEHNSTYKSDYIESPKRPHGHSMSTHSRSWIDRYSKERDQSSEDCESRTGDEIDRRTRRSLEYRLWLEAGKIRPSSLPRSVDLSYNCNMWRNFKKCFLEEQSNENEEEDIMKDIAKMYPISLPKPSKMNDIDIIKYTESAKLIKDPIKRKIVIDKLKQDKQFMNQLQLKSLSRNPPIDEQGNIMPPQGYKKYEYYTYPEPTNVPIPRKELESDQDPDIFGRITERHFRPGLWKLTHRSSNPSFKEFLDYKSSLL